MILLLIFISIIPVYLLGLYIYKKDTVKEPKSLLVGLFASGFFAAIIVTFINILMYFIIPDFYISSVTNKYSSLKLFGLIFFEIALVEEFCKWLMIRLLGYNSKNFDQVYDIIVYSVFVSLGFAAVENILYVVPENLSLGIYRALFSVPGHVSFGVFMGYFLGLAKINEKSNKSLYRIYMLSSVLIPTCFHAIYNFCLMKGEVWYLLVFLVFVIVLYISAAREVNIVSNRDQSLEQVIK